MCTKQSVPLERTTRMRARPWLAWSGWSAERGAVCLGALALASLGTACSPTLTYDGELATVGTIEQVANCLHLGTSAFNIETPKDDEQRDEQSGELTEELLIRARNLAGEIGANRIVVLGKAPDLTREIRMYRC